MSETLDRFIAGLSFEPDDYQVKACQDLDDGAGVLVAAPTGAGKTVVGEYATDLALASGLKCFYTTPIKALSNQKFHDLVARHGEDQVGLLTGDVTINSEAPVIVMTTEVLRNMIYRNSHTLDTLGWVVLDEVHYLADRFRGPVWEEVILGLDPRVKIVGLSATVSNAEEFGEWLDEVRGDVRVVVSERRPVPLVQHVAVARRLYELFDSRRPTEVNPELTSIAKEEARFQRDDSRRPRGRSGKGKRSVSYGTGRFGGASAQRRGRGGRPRGPRNQPSRIQVVRSLHKVNFLPAIIFVFSRSGCDAAVSQLLNTDLVLTSQQEARQLRRIAQRRGEGLTDEERRAVGWNHFMAAFERGIAAHHAGLLPVIKAIVEEGFVAGLLKVVVATETLALGINMPARTVVLEKLVKYNGQTHADITPGNTPSSPDAPDAVGSTPRGTPSSAGNQVWIRVRWPDWRRVVRTRSIRPLCRHTTWPSTSLDRWGGKKLVTYWSIPSHSSKSIADWEARQFATGKPRPTSRPTSRRPIAKGEISPYTLGCGKTLGSWNMSRRGCAKVNFLARLPTHCRALILGTSSPCHLGVTLGGSLSLTLAPTAREVNGLAPLS